MDRSEIVRRLDEQLRMVEAGASAYDAGEADAEAAAAQRIATALRAIFHQSGRSSSLLALLEARLTKVVSTVGKPPYPRDGFSPLAYLRNPFEVQSFVCSPTASGPVAVSPPPRYVPVLGRLKEARQVPAPDWWGHEPVLISDGKKLTRKDIALAATEPAPDGASLPGAAAYPAVLRQVAHEVGKSAELVRLAKG